ncbi:MAG: AAA family ATPase, partial [Muribaculaceae bacterium]|nr:AAA family ATPase [Muribaculaceae bacterium]
MPDLLQQKISTEQFEQNYARLCGAYDLEKIDNERFSDVLKRLSDKLLAQSDAIYNSAVVKLQNHSLRNLRLMTEEVIDSSIDSWPESLQFAEEGMELLSNKQFLEPLTLRQSVYIETQNISEAVKPSVSSGLRYLLRSSTSHRQKEAVALSKIIKNLIGGDVVLEKDASGKSFKPDEFHFVRKDGLNILLKGAATGIISFSYILRLLENGWISKESLLIIDEPEAHMHPQWVVEYARVLVLIKKYIGANVLISTHSPDMVAAIRSISERERILENTVFYIAEEDADSGRFIYRDLDHNIGPIFDSFNIAADRIDLYGVKE